MSLDDVLKGLKAFDEGLTQYAASGALAQANEQVQQLNQQFMSGQIEKQEMNQGLSALSQGLTSQLGQAGLPASQIQTLAGAIAPDLVSATAQAQLDAAAQQQEDRFKFEGGQRDKDRQLKRDSMRAEGDSRLSTKQNDRIFAATKDFNSRTKNLKTSIRQADMAITQLATNNPIVSKAIQTFMAKATGEVGNLTEAEREPFGGKNSILAKLARITSIGIGGQIPDSDKKFLTDFATVMKNNHQSHFDEEARTTAAQFESTIGLPKQELLQRFAPGLSFEDKPTTPREGSGGGTTKVDPNAAKFIKGIPGLKAL